MKFLCPFCQKEIKLVVNDVSFAQTGNCEHDEIIHDTIFLPGIWITVSGSNELINYVMNIVLDGTMYGFDSDTNPPNTDIAFLDDNDILKRIAMYDFHTPLKDEEFYKKEIKRLLNLKAFL